MTWSLIETDDWTLEAISELKPGTYALDTETTGLDPLTDEILLIQVAHEDGTVWMFDARKISKKVMDGFITCLYSAADKIILHNAKFDLKMLIHNYHSVPLKGKIYDTMIAEKVLYNGITTKYASLGELADKYLSIEMDKEVRKSFINFEGERFDKEQLDYAAKDVNYLFEIASAQQYFIVKNDLQQVIEIEMNIIPAVAYMELKGVTMDTDAWMRLYYENVKADEALVKELIEIAKQVKIDYYYPTNDKIYKYDFSDGSYNPNSVPQTRAVLTYLLGGEKKDDPGGTDESVQRRLIEEHDLEFCKIFMEHRKLSKLYGTYGKNIIDMLHPETGKLHASFHQAGTWSGRFSSTDPNLQNIPNDKDDPVYRRCFIPGEGRKFVTADHSQIELRIAGEVSGEPRFIEAYKHGEDIHQITADIIGEDRPGGKKFNFMTLYGAQGFRASREFGVTVEEGEDMVTRWRDGLDYLANWMDSTVEHLHDHGWVATMSGRRRYWNMPNQLGFLSKKDWITLKRYEREAINMPIQGTSADIIKIAIANIFYRLWEYDAYTVLTVHDELVVECPEEWDDVVQKVVDEEMIKAGEVFLKEIPVVVDSKIGDVWGH